jgi:hypothetical protein
MRCTANALCKQWTTSMTGMIAYPVFSTAGARRRLWLRCAPLVSARAHQALHFVQCPVPRADFARSWRAEFLSWRNFRSKFAKRQLARMATSNEIDSYLSQARRKFGFIERKDRLYTFVYVCASGFVADSSTCLTKASIRQAIRTRVVALRASNARLQPMIQFHTLSYPRKPRLAR